MRVVVRDGNDLYTSRTTFDEGIKSDFPRSLVIVNAPLGTPFVHCIAQVKIAPPGLAPLLSNSQGSTLLERE